MAAEIISTVERRRHWPDEEKLRIMSEALAPGATVAAVADRNGVCRSLVYLWLRLARAGRLPGISLTDPPRPRSFRFGLSRRRNRRRLRARRQRRSLVPRARVGARAAPAYREILTLNGRGNWSRLLQNRGQKMTTNTIAQIIPSQPK